MISLGGRPKLTIGLSALKRDQWTRVLLSIGLSAGGELLGVGAGNPWPAQSAVLRAAHRGVVARGRVERMDIGSLLWVQAPTSFAPGTYQLDATYDVGPFGGILKASRRVVVE